ncbi:hypothetical protein U7118_07640 [Bacillus subtilis]|uniref:hypothetical protein n=1 Tax=Bacillus subtilis group TaxID=653685 RepID=UPI001BAC6D57|nr:MULTISPECIES: hypothetical protein [Bacillus subtilis group]MBS2764149.1 hypothetical protein [Bacillus licheniformis]MEC0399923.1 hypothetical protein [Bacillus subtilis]WEZ21229.1 hypothetical protein P5661_06535 [Bacillus subtilis]WRK89098.1 hypothetical protein U7118_07640 [Bacillus subtilis]
MTELQKDIAKLYEAIRSLYAGDYELIDLDDVAAIPEKYGLVVSEEGYIDMDEEAE